MLNMLREVKTTLGAMVISEFWSFWRKTDQVAFKRVKETVLDDAWWARVDLIIQIMDPIISLIRFANIDKPILGEVYEGWDSMIESMRRIILQSECLEYETSPKTFCGTIQDILFNIWDKNCTPLHCLAHSLNPKYYNHEWMNGGPSCRFPPHMDEFSTDTGQFAGYDVVRDKGAKKPYSWWENHGATSPPLQQLAMRLLPQVTSSSCCERNWSTYGNLYSVKKSRLEQSRAETMVYVHTNLCLIYKQREEWLRGKTKMWDFFLDDMGLENSVELALVNMDLNDPVLEPVRFDDKDILEGSSSTPVDAEVTMDIGEEHVEESSGDHDDEDIDADSDDAYDD
eukprot:PITA_20515